MIASDVARIARFIEELQVLSRSHNVWMYQSGESVYARFGQRGSVTLELPREQEEDPHYGLMVFS